MVQNSLMLGHSNHPSMVQNSRMLGYLVIHSPVSLGVRERESEPKNECSRGEQSGASKWKIVWPTAQVPILSYSEP